MDDVSYFGAYAPCLGQKKHEMTSFFFICPDKQKLLPGQKIAGTGEESCGATLLDAKTRPLMRTTYADLFYGDVLTPSHILQNVPPGTSCFRLPSEVHSVPSSFAAIPPPAALWENRVETYSLFFNGLLHYTTLLEQRQEGSEKNLKIFFGLASPGSREGIIFLT